MKVLVDVKDSKASFFMELTRSFNLVKAKPIINEKALLLGEMNEALESVKLAKQGKLKAKPLNELLDE